MSKLLISLGIALVILGLFWHVVAKIPLLGRLPGDIVIQKKNFTFYFPLATSLVFSLLLSLILWLISKR